MDIDECTEWGTQACSQTCLNAPGSYSCGCLPGYLLEPDGHICKLTGKSWGGLAALRIPSPLRYTKGWWILVPLCLLPMGNLVVL